MTADWTCTGRTEDKKKKLPVISSHHETDVNWPKVKHQQRFKLTVLWTCQREIMWMPPISETNPGRVRRRDQKKKVFISSSTPSTTDFAHPLWLSYALSCSRRRQMPSRPLQLAGLSLEPVYQQGYLTASAAPEASDSPSGWEGCQQSPWKERRRKWARKRGGGGETKKKNNEIRRHHSSEAGVTASFQSHHFGDKNKPNYPLKKGHGVASLMMFTVGPVALKWLARLRRTPPGMRGRLA